MTTVTDSNGNISLPGAKESGASYEITLSKTGYYGSQTYAAYPTSTFNPVNIHASVVSGSLTQATLVLDKESSLQIRSVNPFDQSVANIPFSISGGLIVGHEAFTPFAPVYSFTQTTTTNGGGEKDFSDESPGIYTVPDPSTAQYLFLRFNPAGSTKETISLAPDVTQTVKMVLAQKAFASVLAVVKNGADNSVLAGASVRLHSVSLGYDVTVTTDEYGQAYFPVDSTPLVDGTYDVETTLTGFTDDADTVVVNGSALVYKMINLSV
jgi:hypothetical protein